MSRADGISNVARLDPGQQLLRLVQPECIITARAVEMRHIYVEQAPLDVETGDLRHHVQGAIVPVGGFDHGIACQYRLAIDQGRPIDFGLLQQRIGASQPFGERTLEPTPGLSRQADLIEGDHVRLQRGELIDHEFTTHVPAFVVLFEVECCHAP
jgi:hypothetical protein